MNLNVLSRDQLASHESELLHYAVVHHQSGNLCGLLSRLNSDECNQPREVDKNTPLILAAERGPKVRKL